MYCHWVIARANGLMSPDVCDPTWLRCTFYVVTEFLSHQIKPKICFTQRLFSNKFRLVVGISEVDFEFLI